MTTLPRRESHASRHSEALAGGTLTKHNTMTVIENQFTRYWVNDTQTACIRQGDFTPNELRRIADAIQARVDPFGDWAVEKLCYKNSSGFDWCAVNWAENIAVPFGNSDTSKGSDEEFVGAMLSESPFTVSSFVCHPLSEYTSASERT